MVIVAGAALCAEPSLAQFNLAGTWAQLVHEDQGERGFVPRHLPGANPLLREFSEDSGIPWEATRGGAKQMYPEYQEVLQRPMSED